jgi:putative phage-type endonuclease
VSTTITTMVQTATAPKGAVRYHFEIEQGTDEWLAVRRGLITASAISKLLTATGKPANNDTSRAMLYQLLAERITDESEPSFYNDDMARGHLLEPYARELYAEHYEPVQECGFITRELDGFTIGYSPDGLVGYDGLIEIKSPRQKTHLQSLLTDTVPAQYMPQVQTGLAVTGRAWCDFISYAPGLPLYVKRCERDESMILQLTLAAVAAEEQLASLMDQFDLASRQYPATEPIQLETEGEIII